MGSKFEENMTKANEKILDVFKDEDKITFTPKNGEGFETDAILGPIDGEIRDDEQGEMSIKTRRITIPIPELTVAFAEGIATVEGEDWAVQDFNISTGLVDLQCRWNAAMSKHHEMHKKKAS